MLQIVAASWGFVCVVVYTYKHIHTRTHKYIPIMLSEKQNMYYLFLYMT